MRKRLISIIAAAIMGVCSLAANESRTVKTNNGLNVKVQACTDGIFRIQVSPRDQFAESLMERYGIVKTDWTPVNAKFKETRGTLTVTTATNTLVLNKKDGSISLTGNDGRKLVRELEFVKSGAPLCYSLAKVINDKFSSLTVASNGGIIGDDNGQFSEKDKAESGDPEKSHVLSIEMAKGERFYGGGSTSRDHIQHRGELLRMWTTYQHTEIPMPFMVSSLGWGIYNNDTRKNYFDIGYTDKERFNIYNTNDEADFYLFAEKDMPGVLNDYTLTTGRSYLLPKWAYGLCFGPNMREDQWDILNDAVHFRQAEVPCDVFWLEPQWMEKRYDFSTEKKFNSEKFAVEPYWEIDKYPKKLHNRLFIGKLRNMGYHLGLWLCEEYDLSITEEDLIAEREGRAQSGQEHWMDHLTTFMDLGVDGFKMDPARTIDEHTFQSYYNGQTDKVMHNLNQVLLPKQMAMMGRKYNGKRTWHHYCGGWSGTQHWGASTSGDNGGGKTALFDQINLGMSGFLNTSCDVMSVPKEQEMQSLHFGLFLPWCQINSWFSMMHPFYYNEHEQGMYRDYVKMRYELIPYIYSMAIESTLNGMPIVRSMPLVFPDDENVYDMCYQYMFGNSFCLGIFTNEIYLPAGSWIDAWSGEKYQSKGETFTVDIPENRAGLLFIRDGAIIPTMEEKQYIGDKPLDNYIIKVYPHGESSYTLLDCDAEDYEYENGAIAKTLFECREEAGKVSITINPTEGSFKDMPLVHDYHMVVYSSAKPSSVSVNGKKIDNWTYTDGSVKFSIEKLGVQEKAEIVIL